MLKNIRCFQFFIIGPLDIISRRVFPLKLSYTSEKAWFPPDYDEEIESKFFIFCFIFFGFSFSVVEKEKIKP